MAGHPGEQVMQRSENLASTIKADFPPLDRETRERVDTDTAAFHLCRSSKTLRNWSAMDCGPIKPAKISGRLAWSVSDLRRLLAGEVVA